MNIDPKSETQKPDFDKIARLKFDTEHSRPDDGNEMRAYRQGLEDGYNTLQSENQRLTEDIERRNSTYLDALKENAKLILINEELVSFLEEMQDSNYPGCNHTIPGQWKNKGKELIEKSKPLNHEQS